MIGVGTTTLGVRSGGERLGPTLKTTRKRGTDGLGARCGSVGGRLPGGNLRGRGRFWLTRASRPLDEGRPG